MTTAKVITELLRRRYPLPEYALVSELRNATGFHHRQDRYADVAVWSCYPSKGLHRIAFEIKVSRSDFAHELKTPAKRKWLEDYFHETWFAVSHGVCKPEEVPEGWGLIVASKEGDSLRVLQHARHREYPPTEPAALSALRSMAKTLHDLDQRTFNLEQTELSKDDLRKVIEDQLKFEREILMKQQADLHKLRREANDFRDALVRPFQRLMFLAGEFGYRQSPEEMERGLVDIDGLLDKAVERKLSMLRSTMETAARALLQVLVKSKKKASGRPDVSSPDEI